MHRAVGVHMKQFYQLGLCEDPRERTDSVSLLVSVLCKGMKENRGSYLYNILRRHPQSEEMRITQAYGQEYAIKGVNSIVTGEKKRRADIEFVSLLRFDYGIN